MNIVDPTNQEGRTWRGSALVRFRLNMLFSLILVALSAGAIHFLAERSQRLAADRNRLTMLAEVGAALIEQVLDGEASGARLAAFRSWAWASTQGDILGAALLDERNNVWDLQPSDLSDVNSLERLLGKQGDGIDLGGNVGWVSVTSVPVAGGLRLLMFGKPMEFIPIRDLPSWALPVIALAAVAVAWGWLCRGFESSFGSPLRRLVAATATAARQRGDDLPTHRDDEFGAMARNIAALIRETESTKLNHGRLERSVDAQVASRTRQIQGMLKKAERQAWIDPLTKLGNRRLLDDRLEALFEAQMAADEDLSVIVFDIDHFKALNDTLGHAAGDELLRFFGDLLRGSLRSSDIGLRLGGDEFVAILLGTAVEEAAETADRLVKLFRQRASLFKVKPPVMLSAGLASIKLVRPESGGDLIRCADKALYGAKESGKGRVNIYTRRTSPVMDVRASQPSR